MVGFIVRHRQLGLGKILATQNRAFTIRFVSSDQVYNLGYAELQRGGTLSREPLGPGSRCRTSAGECTIRRIVRRPTAPVDPFEYEVALDGIAIRVVSETDLDPVAGGESSDPQTRFTELQLHPYTLFRSRETLRAAYGRMIRNTAGLRALLGSRVDLRPHQAFVAGTVVLDPIRRYILADEVGLGKTIEAGIVIHDLLAQKAEARVLVLCPGALTQQWLCELYAKFGGQLFTLLDLHDPGTLDWAKHRRVIASMFMAGFRVAKALERVPWDMVVVDEAHHLLASPSLYEVVERLSRRTPAVLLLSAIPAHERDDELLRLLALLEPDRYGTVSPEARKRFAALHEQQPHLGRGLRVLERRIAALEAGELATQDVCSVARKLLDIPVVGLDADLRERIGQIEADEAKSSARSALSTSAVGPASAGLVPAGPPQPARAPAGLGDAPEIPGTTESVVDSAKEEDARRRAGVVKALRVWAHDTADRYRLSRRILRNRRTRLLQQGQIAAIERRVNLLPFAPTQAELDSGDTVEALLRDAHERGDSAELVAPLGRLLFQSSVSPTCLIRLLGALEAARPARLNEEGRDFLAMGPAVGYSEWRPYRDLLLRAVRSTISEGILRDALRTAKTWQELGTGAHTRLVTMVEFLRVAEASRQKMIVFAGYPQFADEVEAALSDAFGSDAVTSFRTEHALETKEANVQRFHQEPETWLLVSDESGGEGRNFQFAAEILHVDTPWFVARVEQRIGRLDRLGRELVRPDVVSNVIYNDASAEAGLVRSYDVVIDVYHHSISGLEFALRDVERALITGAMEGGRDALSRGAEQLAELVQRERQRDDAEAVLDEASYEASAAGRFRAIANSDRVDSSIEGAFADYMRQLTQNRGARLLDTPFGQGAVWRFQPEKTCYGALPVDREGSEVLVGNHDGTFRRRVAQAAPRLHFFNVADPLFNAVIRSLDRHPTGRAFAVELTAPSHGPWVGIECRFLASYDQQALEASGGLRNRAEALFVPKPVAVFVDLEGNEGQDGEAIVRLRRRLEYTQRGQTWWDLADAGEALAAALGAGNWPAAATRLIEQARAEARRRFSVALAAPLAEEQARVAAAVETIRGTAHLDKHDAQAQADALETYAAALPNWDVYLDAVGLVSINGKLRAGRSR